MSHTLPMPAPLYHHEEQSRSWLAAIAVAVAAFMIATGIYGGAPWYFYAPVCFALLASLWLLIVNRRSGITVRADGITVFSGPKRREFPRDAITGYRLTSWSEGPDTVHLQLIRGPEYTVPSFCAGNVERLRAALERASIARVLHR
jgi:hypothetical protein